MSGRGAVAPESTGGDEQPIRVFLSYRRLDDRHFVGRLHDRLCEAFGDTRVFRDIDSIPAGTNFRNEILRTLSEVDVVVALIGPRWVRATGGPIEDDYVYMELAESLQRGKPTIPVLIEDTAMPLQSDLPPEVRGITGINAVAVGGDPAFRADATRLIATIRSTVMRDRERAAHEQRLAETAARAAAEERAARERRAEQLKREAEEARRRLAELEEAATRRQIDMERARLASLEAELLAVQQPAPPQTTTNEPQPRQGSGEPDTIAAGQTEPLSSVNEPGPSRPDPAAEHSQPGPRGAPNRPPAVADLSEAPSSPPAVPETRGRPETRSTVRPQSERRGGEETSSTPASEAPRDPLEPVGGGRTPARQRSRALPALVGGVVIVGVFAVAAAVLRSRGDDGEGSATAPTSTAATAPTSVTSPAGGATPAIAGGATAAGGSGDCVVGVSWANYQEERWSKWDEPALKAAIEAGGGSYVANDSKASAGTQARNVENLVSQGANVLVILAQDGTAIKPSVSQAISNGVPVIAYDRLIEDPTALYMTFDNVEVGRMQAREIFKAVPSGNYVIVKGNRADANADLVRDGYEDVIGAAVTAGGIEIVSEDYTDNWDPAKAQTNMEEILSTNNNDVQAVLSENDGMAGGVVAALEGQGLAGQIPVSGQDGDQAALNRVALGTQTVSVWKDARLLGKAAGEAAIQLCKDQDIAKVANVTPFTTGRGIQITSILLTPQPITKDNLNVVIDAGWTTKDLVCEGVTVGSVSVC